MRYLLMAVFLWLPLSFAYANQPTLLRVNQARNNDLDITAYLEVRDEHGAFITSIDPKSLNVKFGDKATELKSIKPFDSAKDGIAYIFLVDISKSTKSNGIFNEMKAALMEWANTLGGNDRTALLTFGDNVNTIVDFTDNPEAFKTGVASVVPSDLHTELNKGIITAVHIGQRIDSTLPSRRVVVVLSDGINDMLGGLSSKEVIDVLKVDPVPIYSIGLDKGLDKLSINSEQYKRRRGGLEAMSEYARISGGDYLPVNNNSIMDVYRNLRSKLSEVFVVKLFCPNCSPNENSQRLQFNLNINTATLNNGIDMRLTARGGVEEIRHDIKDVSQKTDKLSDLIDSISKAVSGIGIRLTISVVVGLGLLLATGYFIRKTINKSKENENIRGGETIINSSTTRIPSKAPPILEKIYPTPHYWLSLTSLLGSRQSSVYDVRFTNDAIIGSGDGCDTVIPNDLEIAPQHCAFAFDGNHVTLYDLGMGNGTLVNGVKITQRYRLEEGDIITLGRTQLRVNLHGIQG